MSSDVWSLAVFRRAYDVSIDVHRVSLQFPKIEQYGGLADQLRRSSKSVCALLAEGSGRQSTSNVECRRYVIMASGSAEECKLWCRYCADLDYVEAETVGRWLTEYGEIVRMLAGLRRHLTATPLKTGD